MNTKIITAIVIAATIAGIAIMSVPVPQTVNAQPCNQIGNPDKGAEVFKCEFGPDFKCTETITPSGRLNNNCHFNLP